MFVFLIFLKNDLGSCSSSEDLSEYISWSLVDWCKFHIHLKNLNVHHFGIFAATALKIMTSTPLSMTWPPCRIS
jgi:hypothetical protein